MAVFKAFGLPLYHAFDNLDLLRLTLTGELQC